MKPGQLGAACVALAGALGAQAQELPEVVVSAERTSALLRLTPVSVGVLERAELDRKGIVDLHDIAGVVAGVTVPNGFSNMPQAVAIRGVGASIAAMSQAVGIYIDDVPLVRGYATALWDLPDIDRIEVLRGPQGSLYGQNASAGAVRFVTRVPTGEQAAWVEAAAGNRGALESRAYVAGALGESLAGSLAISRRTNDGFGWNAVTGHAINKLDVLQFQAKLRQVFAPGSDAVLAIDGAQDRSDTNTTNYPLNHAGAAPRVSYTSAPVGAFLRNAGGASLHVNVDLQDGVLLRSISAVRRYRDDPTVVDFGGLEVQRFGVSQQVAQTAVSQEFQLQGRSARLAWTAGLMLVRDDFDFDRLSAVTALAAPATAYSLVATRLRTTDAGLYGQARFALSLDTGVSLGLRWYHTRQTGANSDWRSDAAGRPIVPVYLATGLSTTANGMLPRLAIDHALDARTFVYASVAEGAKFGGFNRAAESLLSAQSATRPEQVRTWEGGLKWKAAGGAASANVAAFYNDYRDYLAALTNTRINGVLVNDAVLVNAGKAHTEGVDLDFALQLGARTRWTVSAEGLRSRIDAFDNPTGSIAGKLVGHNLPNAPALTLGTSIGHQLVLADGVLSGELSAQHLHRQFSDLANTAIVAIPAQTYFNAQLSYRHGGWTLSARARNIADKSYAVLRSVVPPLGLDASYYNPPRTLLLTLRRDW